MLVIQQCVRQGLRRLDHAYVLQIFPNGGRTPSLNLTQKAVHRFLQGGALGRYRCGLMGSIIVLILFRSVFSYREISTIWLIRQFSPT